MILRDRAGRSFRGAKAKKPGGLQGGNPQRKLHRGFPTLGGQPGEFMPSGQIKRFLDHDLRPGPESDKEHRPPVGGGGGNAQLGGVNSPAAAGDLGGKGRDWANVLAVRRDLHLVKEQFPNWPVAEFWQRDEDQAGGDPACLGPDLEADGGKPEHAGLLGPNGADIKRNQLPDLFFSQEQGFRMGEAKPKANDAATQVRKNNPNLKRLAGLGGQAARELQRH